MRSKRVSLAEAALRLRLTYHQVRALVLRGQLKGGRDDLGRFYVDARDLDRARRQGKRAGRQSGPVKRLERRRNGKTGRGA